MESKASSNSKGRRTRRGREKTKEAVRIEEDRISLLPDYILCQILSFSTTKDAVGSSVLSKRWRYVWTSVPVIDIDDDRLHWSATCPNYYGSGSPEAKERFMDFVDRVLRLNVVSCLRALSLTCSDEYESSRASSWISTVIMRDIENLNLSWLFPCEEYLVELPLNNMFTFKRLVTLKLRGNIILNVFPAVYLPSLKILHLVEMESLDGDYVKNLLAGCPVLEEFHITRSWYRDGDQFDGDKLTSLFVQSTSLKSLHVESDVQGPGDYNDIPIVVDAINLEEIYLCVRVPLQFEVNRPSSLVKVNLKLYIRDRETIGMDVRGNSVVELLRQISNTKHLVLSVEAMEALGYACLDNLPMFHNLIHLKMEMYSCDWPILPYLLDCSPNLVSLHLDNYSNFGENECHQQYHTPKCSMLHLGKIELEDFFGDLDQMKMVSYFLKNYPVLKKMSIRFHNSLSLNQKSELRDEIFALLNGSTDFEIEFLERNSMVFNHL